MTTPTRSSSSRASSSGGSGQGSRPAPGRPAASCSVPPDVLHTFHNPGPGETRFLNLHAPGLGFERYLRGEFPEFDQHYLPEGSGLEPTDVIVLGPGEGERLQLGESTATIKVGARPARRLRVRAGQRLPAPAAAPPPADARDLLRPRRRARPHRRRRGVAGRRPAAAPRSRPGRSTPPPPGEPLRYLNVFTPGRLGALPARGRRGSAARRPADRVRHRVRLKTPLARAQYVVVGGGIEHYR